MTHKLKQFITFSNYEMISSFLENQILFCLNKKAKNMLIFFASIFLYKNHCQSSMLIKFELFKVINNILVFIFDNEKLKPLLYYDIPDDLNVIFCQIFLLAYHYSNNNKLHRDLRHSHE